MPLGAGISPLRGPRQKQLPIWGCLKLWVPFLGCPCDRTIVFWVIYWGPPISGNYHIMVLASLYNYSRGHRKETSNGHWRVLRTPAESHFTGSISGGPSQRLKFRHRNFRPQTLNPKPSPYGLRSGFRA